MANTGDMINNLRQMASPFMSTVINLLTSMQATIEEQQQRIETLERHCGIDYSASGKPAKRKFNPNNFEITLNLATGSSNPTPSATPDPPSPSAATNKSNKSGNRSPSASNNKNNNNNNEDDAKTPSKSNNNNNNNKKDNKKDTRQSRLERLQGGGSDRLSASRSKSRGDRSERSSSRGSVRDRLARGGKGGGKGGSDDSKIMDASDEEYKMKELNLIFKSFKEDVIKLQGNGKSCKKLDMQNGNIQFGKDMLYETDYENGNILKYRMIFDTNGSKIVSGVGFGIAFIDHFNQWGSRNSGDNNSFHIRGDGKSFISDGFEITYDGFDNGKKSQLIKSEGDIVCVELNFETFELIVWNNTFHKQNGNKNILNSEDSECEKIVVKIGDNKKNKKLGFIVYLGGGKAKTISIESAYQFEAK